MNAIKKLGRRVQLNRRWRATAYPARLLKRLIAARIIVSPGGDGAKAVMMSSVRMMVPKGVPRDIVAKINAATVKVLKLPEATERL